MEGLPGTGETDPGRRQPSRRTLLGVGASALVGLAGVAGGVETGVLPGRAQLHEALGLNGEPGEIPNVTPGLLRSGAFTSEARLGRRVRWAVAYPPGESDGTGLPVLVVLHGRGGDHTHAFDAGLGLDRFLADWVGRGGAAFAVASVDGGDSYWHRRASGEDAGAMVTDEFVPLLDGLGLDVARVAFLGWSMGGYGSMLLASRLGPSRIAAVAAESPAIWESADQTPPGAFDGPADYEAHTVFGRQAQLARIPLRVDCGTGDPFYRATKAFVATLSPRPAGGFQPGGHDLGYWRRMAPAQLAFVGRHLHRN